MAQAAGITSDRINTPNLVFLFALESQRTKGNLHLHGIPFFVDLTGGVPDGIPLIRTTGKSDVFLLDPERIAIKIISQPRIIEGIQYNTDIVSILNVIAVSKPGPDPGRVRIMSPERHI